MNFFAINLNEVMDVKGDELECRFKTTHPNGVVGEIKWISNGNHPYTGLFEGGAGFIRMSDLIFPNENPAERGNVFMWPSISVKLLRDGMESGNSNAQIEGITG